MIRKLAIILPFVAFMVGYALFMPVGSIGRQWFDKLTTSDADIRARIEAGFARDSRTFQSLKKYFPQEYEALVASTIADAKGNPDLGEITRRGAEFTENLRKLNAANYKMVEIESMREHLRSTLPQYDYVKSKYGTAACNAMSVGGGVGLLKAVGSDIANDKTLIALFDESSGIFFRLAAEGKTLQLNHPLPTDADWVVVLQRLLEGGMTQDDIDLVGNAAQRPNDPNLCDATVKWLRGIIELKGDAAERVIPYLAGEMAKG